MDNMTYILTGGFLKGYRTYVISGIGVLTAVAAYSTGDANLVDTIKAVTLSMSAMTIRASIPPAA